MNSTIAKYYTMFKSKTRQIILSILLSRGTQVNRYLIIFEGFLGKRVHI